MNRLAQPVESPGDRNRRVLLAPLMAVLTALVLTGCGSDSGSQRAPVSVDDGIRASGQFSGSRLNVDDGEPEVVLGDCDPGDGPDGDLCIVSRSIDGASVSLVIENPLIMKRGGSIPIGSNCQGFACEDVSDKAVVDVRVDGNNLRVSGGRLEVTASGPRYAASFTLRFRDGGGLSGAFDVLPE